MKGLVLYNLYLIQLAYRKNLLLVVVLYTVMAFAMRMTFFPYMLIWMMNFYALGPLATNDGWDRFAQALPVTPRQRAGAGFLAGIAMLALSIVYALIMGVPLCAMMGTTYWEYALPLAVFGVVAMAQLPIMYPCALKWGLEKTRNSLFLFWAALAVGIVLAVRGIDAEDVEAIGRWLESHGTALIAAACALIAAICAAGWCATVHVYAHREV